MAEKKILAPRDAFLRELVRWHLAHRWGFQGGPGEDAEPELVAIARDAGWLNKDGTLSSVGYKTAAAFLKR